MNIAFFEVAQDERDTIIESLPEHQVSISEAPLSLANISEAKDADIISVFIKSKVSKEVIDALPNLKLITTRSTGFDHIDIESAKVRNIPVTNVPSYGSRTVAEFTFALILNLSRKIFPAYHQLREGCNFNMAGLEGFDLQGKTIGVVGTGKIGKNVIQIAQAFAMRVVAHDAHPDEAFAKEHGFSYVSLDQLAAESDIITIHVPSLPETRHLINAEILKKVKKGTFLINTSRGDIVDTQALVAAVTDGTLAGVGLDVLEGERDFADEATIIADPTHHEEQLKTLLQNHVLIDLPNVVITPHIAFFTVEARRQILATALSTIADFVRNGTPSHAVTS